MSLEQVGTQLVEQGKEKVGPEGGKWSDFFLDKREVTCCLDCAALMLAHFDSILSCTYFETSW